MRVDQFGSTRVVRPDAEEQKEEQEEEQEQEYPRRVLLSECVEFDDNAEEIYYVGTSGQKVTELDHLDKCNKLQRLHVRSNLLTSMKGIENCHQLVHLEFYDNQIEKISALTNEFGNLRVLDLSFNGIRKIPEDLGQQLSQLEELYVANNKLKKITGLKGFGKLKKIDLGANRIREIAGLDDLVELEQLWLGKNKITKLQGLDKLTKLKAISVQSNRLLQIEGLDTNTQLEELYLSHNGIEKFENVSHLTKLTVIDIGANRMDSIPDLSKMTELEDLWMNENEVKDFDQIEHLQNVKSLRTLYLEANPIARLFEYRKKLETLYPWLDQIDATPTNKARTSRLLKQ